MTADDQKDKAQLIEELRVLREKVAQLERAENALQVSEERFRKLFEGHSAAQLIIDPDTGNIIDANEAALHFYGWSIEELRGMRVQQINTLSPEAAKKEMENARSSQRTKFEFRHRRADGSIRDVEVFSNKIEIAGKALLYSIIHDTTDRKRAEEALQESERKAKQLAHENAVMAEIGRIISLSLNIEDVYNRFAEKVKELLPFDRIAIAVTRLNEGTLSFPYVEGASLPGRSSGDVIPLTGTVAEKVLRDRKGSVLNLTDDKSWAEIFPDAVPVFQYGIRSILTVPLIVADQVIGVLGLRSLANGAYGNPELKLAERVGNQIAGAIANAQLWNERKRAEEALRESEEHYRILFDRANGGIFLISTDGTLEAVNESFARMHGYSKDEMLGMNLKDLDSPESSKLIEERMRRLLVGEALTFEVEHHHKDGHLFPLEVSASLISVRGELLIQCFHRDITERKRTEEALRESEEKYKSLYDNAPVGYLSYDAEGRITNVNRTESEILGYSREEIVGRYIWSLNVEEDLARTQVLERLSGHRPPAISLEREYRRKDGTRVLVLINDRINKDNHGKITGINCTFQDISERKRGEKLLQESEAKYRGMAELLPQSIFETDMEGKLLFANNKAFEVFGYTQGDFDAGLNVFQMFEPEERDSARINFQKVWSGEKSEIEYTALKKDGTTFPVIISSSMVIRDGKSAGLRGVIVDISERKRIEQILQANEQRFRTLAAATFEGIVVSEDGRIVNANDQLSRMLGYVREELIGRTLKEVMPCFDHEKTSDSKNDLHAGIVSQQIVHKDGTQVLVEVHSQTIDYEGHQMLFTALRDVTDRKRMEDALLQGEARFRQVAESAGEWIWEVDASGVFRYCSLAVKTILGYSAIELVGQKYFYDLFDPEVRESLKKGAFEVFNRKEAFHSFLNPNVHKDGSIVLLETSGLPILDENGDLLGYRGVGLDVTHRKYLEDQLRQSQKMEGVGQLAGGVAHDFNNILAAIMMRLGLLQIDPGLTPEIQSAVRELERDAKRAADLTRQLLIFSRRQAMQMKPLEVDGLLDNLLKMLRRVLGEHISLSFPGETSDMWVEGDAGMLEQVVTNLCVNARDAMPNGGKLSISIEKAEIDAEQTRANPEAKVGRFVCLTVTDTGCGMDKETIKRIFEPFFTTKEVGKGTGLGLSTVYGIVKQHQGWVDVESVFEKGSTFRVYLPAAVKPEKTKITSESGSQVQGGTETILLVEDESPVRRVGAFYLRKIGYTVLEAENGAEALTRWQERKEEISLLITDMVMPGEMNGLALALRFREDKRALKVIISSGYNREMVKPEEFDKQGIVFLAKPYGGSTLARVVRECLDSKRDNE